MHFFILIVLIIILLHNYTELSFTENKNAHKNYYRFNHARLIINHFIRIEIKSYFWKDSVIN